MAGASHAQLQDSVKGALGRGQSASESASGGLLGGLGGNSDQKLDLSGDGLKKQLTEKVCDQVLDYGKSLL